MTLKNIASVSIPGCHTTELSEIWDECLILAEYRNMDDEKFIDIYHFYGKSFEMIFDGWYGDKLCCENHKISYTNSMPETEPVIVDLYKLEM